MKGAFVRGWRSNKAGPGTFARRLALSLLLVPTSIFCEQPFPKVDHSAWDSILKEYVNDHHGVDYARLKKDGSAKLNEYIGELGRAGSQPLSASEKKALLINAYNAFTIHWVIDHYPTASIWNTPTPFEQPHNILGGQSVSLDQIEFWLRRMGDPRIHAALACAARSCPPLRREAYGPERPDEHLDGHPRQWLAHRHLHP